MKKFLVLGMAVLVAVPATVAMGGSSTDRATGGGQVLIGTRGGAGDTIAFTAQDRASNLGQVQYVDRTATGQTTFHGTVTCLRVSGNMAKLAGVWREGGTFQVLVVDNEQGSQADDDLVTVQNNQPNDCAQDNNDSDNTTALARGNAQVYDAP